MTKEERAKQWSFSRLNAFATCPYSYYLKYVQNQPDKSNAFNLYGSYVHSILEKYFKGELELFELADFYESNFADEVTEEFPPCAFCDLGVKYYDDGLKFFNGFEGFDNYKVLAVEKEFTVTLFDDYKFHGFIDLLLQDSSGNIVIMDHKSKKKFDTKAQTEHYALQLLLYGLYVKEKYGVYPDRVIFNMFRSQALVEIDFTLAKLSAAVQWAKKTIEQIEKCEDWTKNYSEFFCTNICGYREICCKKEVNEDGI